MLKRIVPLIALLSFSIVAAAQEQANGVLRLAFRDSRTGAAVMPRSVQINGREHAKDVAPSGHMAVQMPNATYELRVETDGFAPFETMVRVTGTDTLVNVIELDSKTSGDSDTSAPAVNVGEIAGHVVDEATGKLLAGVDVKLPLKNLSARTNTNGFFVIAVPMPAAAENNVLVEKTEMLLSKEGYVGEHRKNVEYVSGQRKTYSIRLDSQQPGQPAGAKVIDEQRAPQRLSTWVYDVTLK